MDKSLGFVDPRFIFDDELPLIVLSDHTSGLVEWAIKMRTKSAWNHAMWMHRRGYFASQGNTYSEAPLSRYMGRQNRLKMWAIIGLTPVTKKLIIASINKKLARPWWQKRYDWLGIVGQALGIKWINTPWLEYCSEDVPQHLKNVSEYLLEPLASVFRQIHRHTSPEDLNKFMEKHPECFRVHGYWQGD